ncbi:MAG: helix-turn-helix domain-containing protein [Kiritimatiellae bacterium]|nr:helix-turn-helix domain-containing protein [Kiritimatiellia bacterium]
MTGSEFRTIRKRMRISQARLAKIMGTFQSTVSRWESLESVPPIPAAFMRVLDVDGKLSSVPEDEEEV